MDKERLGLKHQKVLNDRFKKLDISLSEYSFANLYLFRKNHNYELIFDREIFIKGLTYDGFTYIMPTIDIKNLDIKYLKEMMKGFDFLFPIPEKWLDIFPESEFFFSCQQGDVDYMYTVEKMATYKGRKLHKKRNLLKNFRLNYIYDVMPLSDDRIKEAEQILNQWQENSGFKVEETDFNACMEALSLYKELSLCGLIYYVNKQPAGFLLGEELNDKIYALHFAKGLTRFKGLYQYMYNTLARNLPLRYDFFNFEQDLGKEALRISKSSYVPDLMLNKYRVSSK